MMTLIRNAKQVLILCCLFFLLSFTSFIKVSAKDINWTVVAKTINEVQFIDVDSINYDKRGFLSVITKYSEINPDDQKIIQSNSYLMAIDCKNRLFTQLPVNGNLNQVKNWDKPNNDKLIKTTIINSCSY